MTTEANKPLSADMLKFLEAAGANAEVVDTERPEAIDWDKTPFYTGKVLKVESTKIKNEDRRYLVVETKDGPRSLWSSATLTNLFDVVQPGDTIAVNYVGKENLGGGKTLRKFEVARVPGTV